MLLLWIFPHLVSDVDLTVGGPHGVEDVLHQGLAVLLRDPGHLHVLATDTVVPWTTVQSLDMCGASFKWRSEKFIWKCILSGASSPDSPQSTVRINVSFSSSLQSPADWCWSYLITHLRTRTCGSGAIVRNLKEHLVSSLSKIPTQNGFQPES